MEQEIKEKIKTYRPSSKGVSLFDPNINETSTKVLKFKDEKEQKFRIWLFKERFIIELPIQTSLLFSINFPDKVCLAKIKIAEINGVGNLFTDNSRDIEIQQCIEHLSDDLKSLNLAKNEGLFIYRNVIKMLLKNSRTIETELKMCSRIKSKIERNFPEKIENISFSDLPNGLKYIVENFNDWTIADDFERAEKIKETTIKERNRIISEIEPKLEDINGFLENYGEEPMTEGAIKLQTLAELVTELTIDRKKKNYS